jgi:anaerobic selenocysteine-containing dehydrogenase
MIQSKTVLDPIEEQKKELEWRSAICGICPAGCWVEVGLENGKLVNIKQDTSHPLGMICRRGQHSPEIIYSENRLRYPMRRVGPKGSHQFERISWDEAYDLIAENLTKIKKESGPEAVAIYTGRGTFELSLCDMYQPKGVGVSSASNVLFPFGSPNTMGVGALCYVSFAIIAPHLTMGRMLVNMFTDMENAEMLLVWGANPATDSPPLDMHRLETAAKRGAEVIVIDPRKTETATRTNAKWIPIRPGTDGALALSMIEVMVDEELYDEDFAENWCHGFEELKTYVQHFRPEVAESITGVPADTIRELARRLCYATGACPVMYTGLEYSNTGIQAIRAVHTLFALAGQLDVPGGIGLGMLDSHFPINRSSNQENPDTDLAVAREKFPIYTHYREESHASGLLDSVLKGEPYRIRGLLIHGASLLTSWPQSPLWRETLSKLDFVVCIDRQLTADAAYADVVLPATTMFEIDSYMTYGPIFRLREKVVEPVGEARNDYLIMAELADRLGYGHFYPQSEEAMIRQALEGSGYTLEEVKAEGGWVKLPTSMMEYKKWQKGGLRADGKPGFETPTGKFEIWSTVLEDYGYQPLPKYVEPTEGPLASPDVAGSFPLVFNSGARPHTDFRSQHHGVEGLAKDNPEPTVEVNFEDAEERGIKTGDLVEVRSPRGAVPFRARVTQDIVKGAVECNMGGGGPVGPKAWQEWNVNELTDIENYDEISGFPVYKALLCDVVRLEEGTEATRRTAVRSGSTCEPQLFAPSERKKPEKRIYLDNNATTRVADAVRETMLPYLETVHGNPSSIHGVGRDAREAVDNARRQVAKLINTRPRRIIFTGGGSEADNLAFKGVAFGQADKGKHIITTSIEHPAILGASKFLESLGYEITYLDVDENGWLAPDKLRKGLHHDGEQRGRHDPSHQRVVCHRPREGSLVPYRCRAGGREDQSRRRRSGCGHAEHVGSQIPRAQGHRCALFEERCRARATDPWRQTGERSPSRNGERAGDRGPGKGGGAGPSGLPGRQEHAGASRQTRSRHQKTRAQSPSERSRREPVAQHSQPDPAWATRGIAGGGTRSARHLAVFRIGLQVGLPQTDPCADCHGTDGRGGPLRGASVAISQHHGKGYRRHGVGTGARARGDGNHGSVPPVQVVISETRL